MLDLWLEAQRFAAEHSISMVLPKMVSPTQLYGIETEFYAHELASIVVWIGFLQWKHEHGVVDDREPILQKLSNIEHADAILRYDVEGKPYEPGWPQAEYIVGNPPFLGGKLLRRELGDQYIDDLFALYKGRVKAESDLVVYWFEKARAQLALPSAKRVGLIATQAIRAGSNRSVLERIKGSASIFWAWSSREWTLDGAAVRVAMVAFDKGDEQARTLNGDSVASIHADLSSETETASAARLTENRNVCFMGTTKVGSFEMERETARKMLAAPINPNGRLNCEVVRPWINALDVTHRPRGMYIVDFRDGNATS
jgi:type II restriction/modification system DNA methylase subunit YeeA